MEVTGWDPLKRASNGDAATRRALMREVPAVGGASLGGSQRIGAAPVVTGRSFCLRRLRNRALCQPTHPYEAVVVVPPSFQIVTGLRGAAV